MTGTLYELLQQRAVTSPDVVWLHHGKRSFTYAECLQATELLGQQLRDQGLGVGDRVAVYMTKTPAAVIAMLACSQIEALYIPVNPLFRAEQLHHVLCDCEVKGLCIPQARVDTVKAELFAGKSAEDSGLSIAKLIVAQEQNELDSFRIENVAGTAAARTLPARFKTAELILYTSGSTGRPKGVVVSRENLLLGARSVASYLALDSQDKILALLPFAFDYGLNQLTSALASGAQLVLFDFLLVGDVVKAVRDHGVTGIAGVPPLWFKLVDTRWEGGAGDTVRFFTNSGGHMGEQLLQRLTEVFTNAKPFLMYGFTEAFRSTFLDPCQLPSRSESIGKAVPHAEVFVLDASGKPATPGARGELVHCGPLVTLGYWDNERAESVRFRPAPACATLNSSTGMAAWSGDSAYMDTEGYLFFVGREDEMIKSSGYRISPEEIEEIAYTLEGISEAVATGLKHETLGQEIVLVVTTKGADALDETGIRHHFRRSAPEYMVPARVHIWDELPRNASAKFDRVGIKRRLQDTSA